MKLCNLFLYQVKEVTYDEVFHSCNGDLWKGIIKCLDIECEDKLYLYDYKKRTNEFVPLSDGQLLGISDDSEIVAVDMHSLGQSNLNERSFGHNDSFDMIYEKYEAMEYYREFHKKIKDDINLRQSLIVGCRNNISIEKHLSHTSYEDGPSKPNYLERTSFNEKNDFSKCDHLISLSNFYNHNTCDVSTKIYFLNSET